MCGIAGLLRIDGGPISPDLLRRMARKLAHRGPDGERIHVEGNVGLAHRRLSIIDVAGGTQPMASEDGTVTVVFNGEIYNFQTLRNSLAARGHTFRTSSDTECLVHGWEEWGSGVLDHLEGMFAFAIWDRSKRSLFMARDPLGKKPLYYTLAGNLFAFASELQALADLPGLNLCIKPEALDDFLALAYVPDPDTIFQGILKLPPAHALRVDLSEIPIRALPKPARYWQPELNTAVGSFGDAVAALRLELQRATEARLIADVPLGAFLSGGVDSAAVVAAASAARRGEGGPALDTFTIGLPGQADETSAAAAIARHCGARHTIERADAVDWIAAAGQQGRIFGEPFGDPSAVLTLQVCQLARKHVTVALSGDGGDEVFGGYRRHQWHLLVEAARRYIPARLRQGPIASLARLYPKLDRAPRFLRAKHTLTELSLDAALAYYRMSARCQDDQRRALLSPTLSAALDGHDPGRRFSTVLAETGTDDPLKQAQAMDLATWLPGQMLVKVDRTSMASSLEVRSPLLDPKIVSFGLSLPSAYKIRGGQGKSILRAAAAPLLPHGALDRKKQGFAVPLAEVLRRDMPRVRSLLLHSDFLDWGLLRPDAIARLLADHEGRRFDYAQPIWLLLVLQGFLASEMDNMQAVQAA